MRYIRVVLKAAISLLLLQFSLLSCGKFDPQVNMMYLSLLGSNLLSGNGNYSIGGTITGLSGNVTLQLNNSNAQSFSAGNFVFSTTLTDGNAYLVNLESQPADQMCSLNLNAGTVNALSVSDVEIICVSTPLMGGSVSQVPAFSGSPVIDTLAGRSPTTATAGYSNGAGSGSRFDTPEGLTTDGSYLFVADSSNHTIRKVSLNSPYTVTDLAGGGEASLSGFVDGTGTAARFNNMEGVTTDGTFVYIADTGNHLIRKVKISTGITESVAGCKSCVESLGSGVYNGGYLVGSGTDTEFNSPVGITTDGNNLYISDNGNDRIMKVVIGSWDTTVLAGPSDSTCDSNGGSCPTGFVDGSSDSARFDSPEHLTTDSIYVYVADKNNDAIRRIRISDGVTDSITPSAGAFTSIRGISTDGTNLYFTDSSTKDIHMYDALISAGTITTLAGQAGNTYQDGDAVTIAEIAKPRGIVSDGNALYFCDSDNHSIRKYY